MKRWKLTALFFLFCNLAFSANPPLIWDGGNRAKFLTPNINIYDTAYILTGSSDPTSVAQTGAAGSLYIRSNGSLYIKTDAGSSTNWSLLPAGAASSIGNFNGTSTAKGLDLTANVLSLHAADATNPGALSVAAQDLAGQKTLLSAPIFNSLTASLPLKLDASKVATAAAINLSGSEVTGVLPNANTTAVSTNTASKIVTRDVSGDFSAGIITASLTGHASLDLPLTGGTLSGALNLGSHLINSVTDPASAQDAATKNYVDTQLLQLNPADAVYAASIANVGGTYTNAVSGVCIGDIFTTTATTAFALDGVSPVVGARVLFKDQTNSFQDGVWTLTTQAVGGVSGAVLTRALDFDSTAGINAGQIIPIIAGTVNAGASYYQTATNTTCNSSTQTWTQFQKASSAYLLAANNFSDVASASAAFDTLSGMTTLGDILYGGTSGTRTRLAGQTTSTKKYLSQTGNGSASAAPAWAQVAFADLSGSVASTQMPALTSDVTTSAGAVATTVAKIQGTTVSGTTGSTNVVFSASPTLTGTIAGANETLSGTLGVTGVATFTAQPLYGANNISIQAAFWAGYHKTDCSWTMGSSSIGNPGGGVDSSCTFTELLNRNMGTAVSYNDGTPGNNYPGVTLTLPRTGFYHIIAVFSGQYDAANQSGWFRLSDGTTAIAEQQQRFDTASQSKPIVLDGIYSGTAGSVTLRIQMAAPGAGNLLLAGNITNLNHLIHWTVIEIN